MFYEVRVQNKLEVHMPDKETKPHVMRVGWSVDSSPFAVGEAALSYGYGGTGRASCNNKFSHYGEPYSTDDVITCYIDLDAVPKAIFFAKNGKYLDVAFRLGSEADGKVFYPHISVKNMRFVANFGAFNPHFPPVQGFCFIQHLPPQMLSVPPTAPRDRRECEVLMMVGLPSCGKTTWLEKYVKDHPEKKYNVLGSNDILVKMKVMGLTRKRNYHGRWDALIKQATGILNEMLKVAKHKNRNYILDQTNVYPNARHRKMGNFKGYRHIAVVLVNENSVLMQRNAEVVRRDGKIVPESAFMEMKSNFTLPVQGEVFDEVWYVEENEERSHNLVLEFNEEGRNWKENQKKRPIDDVQVKTQTGTDLKKTKYGETASSDQYRNQYGAQGPRIQEGGFQHGSHSQHSNQGGRPAVPVQESHPADTRREEYQQPNQNAYPQRQQQSNPPYHGRNRNFQHEQGNNHGEPERPLDTGSHGREVFHQGQPRGNFGYQQGGQDGGRFPHENTGNNQLTVPQGMRGEGGQSRNNPRYYQGAQGHQSGQGDWRYSHGNGGNNYNQPPQDDWGKSGPFQGQPRNSLEHQRHGQGEGGGHTRGNPGDVYHQPVNPHSSSQNENYSRSRNENSSTQPGYTGLSQGYPIKKESLQAAQGVSKNPNESYYGGNQPGGYDSSQNYPLPKAYNDPFQGYHGSSESRNAQKQGGLNNQSHGYWGGGQGWGSAPGSQDYSNSQPNVPQINKTGQFEP